MSKPDLPIVHSPEAEAFLRMVTEGFYNRSYTGLWIFEVIGREWDELRAWSEGMRTEIHPQTCTWSIAIWEWVYGFEPDESLTLEERRRRILSKVIGARPINPEVIRRGITSLTGIPTKVTDFTGPYAFGITLYPDIKTTPDEAIPDGRIVRYVQEVKPAHLRVSIGIEVRREFRYTIPVSQGGAAGSRFFPHLAAMGELTARSRLYIMQGGTNQTETSVSDLPDVWQTARKRLELTHPALVESATGAGDLPDVYQQARTRVTVMEAAAASPHTDAPPPEASRTAQSAVSVAQGAFQSPETYSDTPDTRRASTGRTDGSGGLFYHTHTKSKLIE